MNSWHKYLLEQKDRCDRLWELLSDYIGPNHLKVILSMDDDCIRVYYMKNHRTLLWFAYKGTEDNELTVYHSKGYTLYEPLSEEKLIREVKEFLQKYDIED